jgi:hypothetical protein
MQRLQQLLPIPPILPLSLPNATARPPADRSVDAFRLTQGSTSMPVLKEISSVGLIFLDPTSAHVSTVVGLLKDVAQVSLFKKKFQLFKASSFLSHIHEANGGL